MAAREQKKEKGSFYREAPFWSWNDSIDAKEARRQIDAMAAGGWGGFFMHARPGLVTPYMGKKWMEVIKACVARAKKLGMCAYLYDEYCWPSGFAGGAVPKKGAKFRARILFLSENLVEKDPNCKWVASFRAGAAGKVTREPMASIPARGGGRMYHFYRHTMGLGDAWFHGTSYVNLLEGATTDEFLKTTHEKYKAALGSEFGKTIPAMFTDEPSLPFITRMSAAAVPWSQSLPRVFKDRRGYDILDHLPSLFLAHGDFRKVRYDFHRTVTEMFVENYTARIYKWCDENNLPLTGHMMAEDTISSQVRWSGAAMPHYEYMHMPGMDHLGRNIRNPATAKQVTSVAEQLGMTRVLSELYGCSGQHLGLKGRKWIADWHFALGVNLLNPHLWLYSMRGARKRDFPPTISYQQPHWLKSKPLSDRNAMLSYLLTRGKRIVDVLVIHPVETGWCLAAPGDQSAMEGIDKTFAAVVDTLLAGHVDFHFGDESLLAKYGCVAEDKLRVDRAAYSVVVLPGCLTLRRSTVRLLNDFTAAGGRLVVVGERPTLLEGSRRGASIIARALRRAGVVTIEDLPRRLRSLSTVNLSITGANSGKVLYHLRDLGTERLLFLANTDCEKGAKVTVRAGGLGAHAGVLRLASGNVSALGARRAGGVLRFALNLAETESAVVVLRDKPCPAPERPPARPKGAVSLAGQWRLKRMDENALTVDYVRIPLPAYGWGAPQYVLFAAEALAAAGGTARARYEFEVETLPRGPVHIAVERPGRWEVLFNGKRITALRDGYFVDKAFRRLDVTDFLREGRNVLEVRGRVTKDFELESIYVAGRFGVYRRDGRFVIGAPPATVKPGDLTPQGLSFFAGVVDLEKEVVLNRAPGAAVLSAGNLFAGAAEVMVNGRRQGELNWPPYELEIKGLKIGRNRIVLRLYGTLRNLLGPHHFEGEEIEWVSPGSFSNRKLWTDDYRFVEFGFEGAKLRIG